MLNQLLAPAKNLLRGPYRDLKKKYLQRFHGFDAAGLSRALQPLGITQGSVVFVHSGLEEFVGFSGRVADIVRSFEETVGQTGTLLMPTIPFVGSAIAYARKRIVFDAKRTPSQVGMITEVFRRFPQVQRSLHPTHPIAVWGADAAWWTAPSTHPLDTPCGRGTPFERLHERNGTILFAGVTIDCLTFFHYGEELLESRMPFSPFTSERFSFPCRVNGEIRESDPMRLYAPAVSQRRDLSILARQLQSRNAWKTARVGTLNLIAIKAGDIIDAMEALAARGEFCYRPEPVG